VAHGNPVVVFAGQAATPSQERARNASLMATPTVAGHFSTASVKTGYALDEQKISA
jgi:hypothetical protein